MKKPIVVKEFLNEVRAKAQDLGVEPQYQLEFVTGYVEAFLASRISEKLNAEMQERIETIRTLRNAVS